MRLALVLDRFDPAVGGLEQWAWHWAAWLLDRGHEVAVVASEGRTDIGRDGLTLHSLGFAQSRTAFAGRVAAHLERLPVDLVHDLGVGWRYDLLQPHFGTRLADDLRNLRSLPLSRRLTARLSAKRRRRLADIRTLERRQYAGNPGHVIAISEMTRDDLVRHHDLPEERITIVHNGVDTNRFRPMPADERRTRRREAGTEDRFTLLFAGHNFRLKGLGTVLRALARLRSPRLHLLVAGRGQIEKYRRLADRLGVSSQVTFAGFIPDMREAYALADAFVQPTFYDPCSLVILEAAACGLPVVTSRFNGAAELFRDGVSAFILRDPGDAAETARSIETLFDPGIRSRVAAAGLLAAGEATAEKSFQKLLGICMHTLQYRQAA